MALTVEQCLTAIRAHTRALADAADGHVDRPVEHCPGWTVADLVWHLTEVQWFWSWVARERPTQRPTYVESPARPVDGALTDTLRAGVEELVSTLRQADQAAPCWTWASQKDVGFITRHQVQEAAVHHFDAANATGADWSMDPLAAMDAVEEVLTFSVPGPENPATGVPPMNGTIRFCPCVADVAECPVWCVTDGLVPGTVAFAVDAEETVTERVLGGHGDPADFLLWLYERLPDRALFDSGFFGPADFALADRFRALTSAG